MKTKAQIREDLRQIKYYYSRKEAFDYSVNHIANNTIVDIVKEYNNMVTTAPANLYDIYVMLYTANYTQMDLAEDLELTPEYISKLNAKLISFFEEKSRENNN